MDIFKDDLKDINEWVKGHIANNNKKYLSMKNVSAEAKMIDRVLKELSFKLIQLINKDYGDDNDDEDDNEDDECGYGDDNEYDDNEEKVDESFVEELEEESDLESDLE